MQNGVSSDVYEKKKDKQKNVKKEGERGEEMEKKKKRKGGGILQIRVGVLSLILKGDFLKF